MIEEGLQSLVAPTSASTLYDPIRYTLESGGKRLRPMLTAGVIGKHAVYFEFLSDETGEIASFDRFTFS